MNEPSCCRGKAARATGFLLSSIMLILMPKCPVCLAAHVALFTGIGLSTATAGYVRMGFIIASACVIASFVLVALSKIWRTRSPDQRMWSESP